MEAVHMASEWEGTFRITAEESPGREGAAGGCSPASQRTTGPYGAVRIAFAAQCCARDI